MSQQLNPDQPTDVLDPTFQKRNEPNFSQESVSSMLLALPALRGCWPMSSVRYASTSRATDISGQDNHLTSVNTVDFGYDNFIPYAEFDGTNQYLYRSDGGAANWADNAGMRVILLLLSRV